MYENTEIIKSKIKKKAVNLTRAMASSQFDNPTN